MIIDKSKCVLCVLGLALSTTLIVLIRVLWESNAVYVYLFMIVLVWIASLLLWSCCGMKQYDSRNLYILNFVLLYVLLVFSSYAYGYFLDYKLSQFDLDGDTFFSAAEQTPEQERYMQLVINDAGRNLIFILGIIYSFFSTFILLVVLKVYGLFTKNMNS